MRCDEGREVGRRRFYTRPTETTNVVSGSAVLECRRCSDMNNRDLGFERA
jgi:hypothetical protein